jgi:hypothetical protein
MDSVTAISVDDIPKWSDGPVDTTEPPGKARRLLFFSFFKAHISLTADIERESPFVVDPALNACVSIWKGDLLALEVDGVLNATSEQFSDRTLQGKRIASLAGPELAVAISRLDGCRTGEAKITPGYNLKVASFLVLFFFSALLNEISRRATLSTRWDPDTMPVTRRPPRMPSTRAIASRSRYQFRFVLKKKKKFIF